MLSVNTNSAATNTFGALRMNQLSVERGFERLSSGLRINGARDDAAGLSISTRMTSQVRGAQQAVRNTNDSISFIQTAEGALNETTSILQRMRELTVQAGNEILSTADREAIQSELNQLMSEIDRINETTNFNNNAVFSQHNTVSLEQTFANGGELNGYKVNYNDSEDLSGLGIADAVERRSFAIESLKTTWLPESERMVEDQFGLFGVGGSVEVDFVDAGDAPGDVLAFVVSSEPQRLHLDLNDFPTTNSPHGGTPNLYSDRIIAHEFVHIAMNATGTAQAVEGWFNEGAAELINGAADTRMSGTTAASYTATVADAFNNATINYEGAYIATAYLHEEIQANGGTGIKDLFAELQTNGNSLDAAIATTTTHAGLAAFQADFQTAGNGDQFAADLKNASLASGDTGAIGGSILDGGAVLNAEDVISNEILSTTDKEGGVQVNFHIGGNSEDDFTMSVGSFNTNAMGLNTIDITDFNKVDFALSGLDDALKYVSKQRSKFGALQNRFESTINNLSTFSENTQVSRSRIVDADFSQETVNLTQAQIIQQASVSVLAQTNVSPQIALELLI